MNKGDIPSAARLNRAPIGLVERDDTALALLRAVAFRLSDDTNLHLSPASQASDLFGTSPQTLPRTISEWTARLSPEDIRARRKAMRRLTWDGARYKLRYQWRTDQGESLTIEERGQRIAGVNDIPTDIEGVFRDVGAEDRASVREKWLATQDALTGLDNTAQFERALSHMIALAGRDRTPATLLRVRLTNIADLNSVYGYDTGDRLIAEIARRLAHAVRAPDVVGRIGGVDFGICLYGADAQAADAMADRLRFILENAPVKTPYGGLYAELAFSATETPEHAAHTQEALDQTAIAIGQGLPNGVSHYTASLGLQRATPRVDTEADDILDALNQRRVQLAYQPIVAAKSRKLHHYECLLRLRRPDGEIVSAGRFIIAAERLGLVHLLDRRALELASETLLKDPDVHLALNVSAATVKDRVASEDYLSALRALGPQAKRVTLELTETVALDDPAMASAFSNDVRALGCGFAIDDFGSGYTTFRNLMAIEADMIKIDGTLIEGIATDANKQMFVRMMVDLAQTFSVKTVTEMVDDRGDAEVLRRLNVDYLQGFMFGVPSPAPAWQRRAG